MPKQVITVRLDESDVEFLAAMDLEGAVNLSEKLRALIRDARQHIEPERDPVTAFERARSQLVVAERYLKEAELSLEMRSELLARVLGAMPEIEGLIKSASAVLPDLKDGPRRSALERLERQVAERLLSLVDSIGQMTLAGFPGCYDGVWLTRRAASAVRTFSQAREGHNDEGT